MRRPENNQQRPNQAHSGANHSLSFIPADQKSPAGLGRLRTHHVLVLAIYQECFMRVFR